VTVDPHAAERSVPDRADLLLSRRLARVMDDLVTVPGTRIGLGADAVLGLVPGVGDVVGSTLSGLILADAVRARVPLRTLLRMAWNVLLDALLGLVPVVGDLLDVAHRANRKNLRLLERAVAADPNPRPPTVGYLASAVALVLGAVLAALGLGLLGLWLLVRWLL
jgi:hypothetical protein